MARVSKPWFRTSQGTWYCTMEGRKVSLKVRGRENEAEAVKAWHRLFAGMPLQASEMPRPSPIVPQAVPMVKAEAEAVSVEEVINGFLADCEGRVKQTTLRWYRDFLTPFQAKHGKLEAIGLTCPLAEAYSRKPEWCETTRHDFLGTLVAAFRWAERAKLIDRTPLVGLRRPPQKSRGETALITAEEHSRLLSQAPPPFAMLLRVLWAVGCRPTEAASITAENFDAEAGLVRLAEHKTAHKGKRRVLYLPPEIVALLRKQRKRHPQGALLRNRSGKPWTAWAITKAMSYCRERAGIPHAIAYGLRHSFATDALANGVPDAQVAALLGHSGTAMLHKHYSHLGARAQVLKEALGRVR